MHLKLDSLQRLVDKTLVEERLAADLKDEISRVLGPVVVTEGRLSDVVAAANDRLDVLDRTGRGALDWEPKVTLRWLDHTNPEIRRFAARIVPERHLGRVASDVNPTVRAAAAARLPISSVKEMIKRFPKDDQLRSIFRKRSIVEGGIAQPVVEPMGHDPVDEKERLGDNARTHEGPELSETWYREQALRLVSDYGRGIECAWEERAVNRFCSSVKATAGIDIDEARLLKSVKKLVEEKEDRVMERDALKETLDWLVAQEERELLDEGLMPEFVEDIDAVRDLLAAGLTREQYVVTASRVFNVQRSTLPLGIRKYRLGEGNARQTLVPCVGTLPHQQGFRAVDERALDAFCEHWSRMQQQEGEPFKLQWSTHPSDVNRISFNCRLL